MLKMHEIREIIKLIDQSGVSHFELDNEGAKLLIRKENNQSVAQQIVREVTPIITAAPVMVEQPISVQTEVKAAPKADDNEIVAVVEEDQGLIKITSPMVGTFYEAPNPNAKPFVAVGDSVDKNTVVCIVEAMKLFNEIEAEVKGKIAKVLVENGQLVEYGQPLFLVKQE